MSCTTAVALGLSATLVSSHSLGAIIGEAAKRGTMSAPSKTRTEFPKKVKIIAVALAILFQNSPLSCLPESESEYVQPGRSQEALAIIEVPAGQADGSVNPGCPPAQCGTIEIKHIPVGEPKGALVVQSVRVYYYHGNSRGSRWDECQEAGWSQSDRDGLPRWDCKYYARFDHLTYSKESDGSGWRASIRFRNWASQSRKGKLTIRYWAYLAR
jgi:hypothetical protein